MSSRAIGLFLILAASSVQAAEKALTFAEAYQEILNRSIPVATQKLQIEIAETDQFEKTMAFAPSLSAQASQEQAGDPATKNNSTVLVSKLNLYRFGADLSALGASKAGVRAESATGRLTRQSAETTAIRALIALVVASQGQETAQRLLQTKQESLSIAKQRYAQGLLPLQDVDKLTIEVENSRARLSDSESTQAAALADLETLLGKRKVALEWPWRERVANTKSLLARDAALDARPDYQALQHRIDASRNLTDQARRSLYPSLDLSLSYGRNAVGTSNEVTGWTSAVVLTVPIFERFKGYADYRSNAYSEQIAELKLEQLRRSIGPEIESLKKKYAASVESALGREKTLAIAQKLYRENVARFRAGRASVNDLSVDQSRLLESELLNTQGWSSAYQSYSDLCHALGLNVRAAGDCASPD